MNVWIRLWFAVLVIADRLLGTHLVEWELARLQRRIEAYKAQASAIRQQMEELNRLLQVAQVELCVLYLRQRRILQPDTWLRFAPAESADEERDLDMLIDRLVKRGLAAVRTEPVGEQTYVYHLCPDWAAIVGLLSTWEKYLDPLTVSWLEELRRDENGEIHH
ncbi:MAG TPA: hypothetical protein G4N97_05800 [Thermoflexia bacterium]|nr:hypothetical protein [Thermoflexia bacterium]